MEGGTDVLRGWAVWRNGGNCSCVAGRDGAGWRSSGSCRCVVGRGGVVWRVGGGGAGAVERHHHRSCEWRDGGEGTATAGGGGANYHQEMRY